MSELVNANRALFVKTYTADKLVKITGHVLSKADENTGTMWKCVPVKVILNAGKFTVHWEFHAVDVPMIDLGELESRPASRAPSPSPSQPTVSMSMSMSPVEQELKDVTSEIQVSRSRDDVKREKERKRVYEARLRAKLAVFNAEKAIQRYIDKYGDSELSDSDSDEDEEEGMSGSDTDAYSG
jgi:hypothetical protein